MTDSSKIKEKLGFWDLLILVLSVYVLLSLLVYLFFELPPNVKVLLQIIDDGICIIFLLDFFLRFFKAGNKLAFITWGWIDLVSSIPSLPLMRFGRLFRMIRIFRILRAFRSLKAVLRYVFKNRVQDTMSIVGLITFLVVIFSSISILLVETDPAGNIKSAEDAIWWSLETITTAGYGDKFPVTTEGRFIGVLLMFVGVGLLGTFTAFISSWFITGINQNSNHNAEIDKT